MVWLAVGVTPRTGYSKRGAKEMLAGFAFGVVPLTWKLPAKAAKTVNGTARSRIPSF